MNWLKIFFPGFRSARRARSHQPYFHPFKFLWTSPPKIFEDLPASELEEINQRSKHYFEDSGNREYWANKPFSDRGWGPWFLWRFGLLLDCLQIRPGDSVLDFGCGSGWTSLMISKIGAHVTGMDIAPAALQIAKDTAGSIPNLHFNEFDGHRIPAEDESFDFVIVFEAFHHLPNRMAMLKEFFRVLAPHGLLGFAEPGVGHSHAEMSHAAQEEGVLEQDIDLEQLFRSAQAAGFQDMQIAIPAVSPHNFTLSMRRLRWFIRGFSFLASSNLIRTAILTGPIGVIHKSPYAKTSLQPGDLRARIQPESASIQANSDFELRVKIQNLSDTVWLKEGRHGAGNITVGVQLKSANGELINRDFARAKIPHDLRKNETANVSIRIEAPAQPGKYQLVVDMVDEGICWFGDRGSQTSNVELIVT